MNLKGLIRKALEHSEYGYPHLLRHDHRVNGPHGLPNASWANAVLQNVTEVANCLKQVRALGLPPCPDPAKNWDSLAALDLILRRTDPQASIFDAGGELYSMILPWLHLYGYKRLLAGNLVFDQPVRRGRIRYEHADITRTTLHDESFDVITCLSVIEHGVDLDAYFREMSRLLRVGGLLITSTDYFETAVDAKGLTACGAPVHIFTREEIRDALTLAQRHGLVLISPLDLRCTEKVVHWGDPYNLDYTFLLLSMARLPDSRTRNLEMLRDA